MEKKKDISNRLELLPGFCHSAEDAAGALHAEENIREKVDEHGVVWSKVYFGSGSHYQNWLKQVYEVFGEDHVAIEPVAFTGLACFTESDDKAFRIWVKKKTAGRQDV